MKNLTLPVLMLVLVSVSNILFSQTVIKEDFFDAEFFLSEEDYREALYSFQKVYKAGYQDNANINYRIGICYLNLPGQKEASIPYLEKAVTNISEKWVEGSFKEVTAPPDANLFLGNAYRIANRLADAIIYYNKYHEGLAKSRIEDLEYTNQQIQACERAKKVIEKPVPLLKENLGKKINTNTNNKQVIFSGDNNAMAFLTELRFYDAVFFLKKINGTWSNSMNITPQIESDGDQYPCSLSFDGQKLFLVKMSNFEADIYVSEYRMGRWMPSKPIGKPVNSSKYFESHASIAPDGKTLYFTSNRKESLGGMDIFFSKLNEKGAWSEPVNLGSVINTKLNEETPFIANDGKTLFFSSQGHENIGGFDIFKSIKQNDGTWSKPVPLPYPINTTDDDIFFFPAEKENSGYMTLYEPNGLGAGDLYRIEIITEPLLTEKGKEVTQPQINESVVKEVETKPAVVKTPEKLTIEKPSTSPAPAPTPSVKYLLRPIYFVTGKTELSETSIAKLDEISKALVTYPEIKLEVRGHTDDLGSLGYNQILSEKRAKAVIDYLVSKNVAPERFSMKGFSKTENIAVNVFPDGRVSLAGRKLNRRVEFKIVTDGGALLVIEPVMVPDSLKVQK
jgi:outer membrane protein OmpA-like peptidoglycan-associated protein/tetratricopeptide (TPR) repeat protein